MLKILTLVFVAFTLSSLGHAQKVSETELDIDLMSFCEEESLNIEEKSSFSCSPETGALNQLNQNLSKGLLNSSLETCQKIKEASALGVEPVELKVKDDQGNPWKISFHFGHSRMFGSIKPTDIKIASSKVNTVVKSFVFEERTSDTYFNPFKWKELNDSSKWIDEPSNTMTLSIENKNNAFYITAYHPKVFRTVDEDLSLIEKNVGVGIGNTHKLMVWQLGYGRKFTVFKSKRGSKLTYIPRVDAGIQTGQATSLMVQKEPFETEQGLDDWGVQGYNVSLGHRLEYQRGRLGVFVDRKYIFSKIEHGFLDGTATYNMQYVPTTFGVTLDLVNLKKKKTKDSK